MKTSARIDNLTCDNDYGTKSTGSITDFNKAISGIRRKRDMSIPIRRKDTSTGIFICYPLTLPGRPRLTDAVMCMSCPSQITRDALNHPLNK